jgi:hypothetical protein
MNFGDIGLEMVIAHSPATAVLDIALLSDNYLGAKFRGPDGGHQARDSPASAKDIS